MRRFLLREWSPCRRREEALAILDRLEGRSEAPSLQELAELLECSRVGFASLTRLQLSIAPHLFPDEFGDFVSPGWILERLDLGLRALRLERGLTQAQAAEAAGFKPIELSAVEDPRRRETPTLAFLDRMLLALGASYRDLEESALRPLRAVRRLAHRARVAQSRARPVVYQGKVLPPTTWADPVRTAPWARPSRSWTGRPTSSTGSTKLPSPTGRGASEAVPKPARPARLPGNRIGLVVHLPDRLQPSDLALAAAALLGGWFFFSSLGALWPLARMDLDVPRAELEARAGATLLAAGFSAEGYDAASELTVDDEVLDYLQRRFGNARTQALIARGLPVFQYEVHFKRRGRPDRLWVDLPAGPGVIGWGRTVQEDARGASISMQQARRIARQAIAPWLAPPDASWREEGRYEQTRPHRQDHYFVFERYLVKTPPLRERLVVTVSGRKVTAVDHTLVVPESARRNERRRQAPIAALQMIGFLLAGAAALGAFGVFLTRLRSGTVRLAPAARWVAVIGACFLATQALRPARLLLAWDPLWPRWVADLQTLGTAAGAGAWILLVLFVVIAAGDALDREGAAPTAAGEPSGAPRFGATAPLAARRGEALWAAVRGRWTEAAVGLASVRGFLVGLICGGVMAASVLAIEHLAGGWSPIQPQGFFFYPLNSSAPALTTLLYFLMVALVEELAYRFFAGTWLLRLTGSRLAAIVLPAILYGTTHTGLSFVPPAEPFWGRALVFTLIGCVWGWAFLRYDALTVVLSHFSADLFIFNWPRLGSGDPILVAKGLATLAVPLVPALLWLAFGRGRRRAEPAVAE